MSVDVGTSELVVDRDGPVCRVTFNRPHRHNAFTTPMYQGLGRLFDTLEADPSVRVVVLRGAGSVAFAAGNEIAEFAEMTTGAEAVAYEARVQQLLSRLSRLPQVSLAAVDGLCVGGGLAVATFCDLRICTAGSRFGYPIARTLGNALSRPLLHQCVRVFGESLTQQMLLASRLVDAQRAFQVGAVMSVSADRAELDVELETVTAGLLAAAPVTLQATKRQLQQIRAGSAASAQDGDLLEAVYASGGFREGVRAFLAKEKPTFPPDPLPDSTSGDVLGGAR